MHDALAWGGGRALQLHARPLSRHSVTVMLLIFKPSLSFAFEYDIVSYDVVTIIDTDDDVLIVDTDELKVLIRRHVADVIRPHRVGP